jgi:ubiquinone/menaquinone biosynthesis C-methylase UbiE
MSFDRLAPFYRAMEFVTAGPRLQRCRLAFLDEIPPPRRILLAGEGHGRFLPECARRFPAAEIVVIDISQRMLEIARGKLGGACRAEFVRADLLDWQAPAGNFDLIVTHFFLDCFDRKTLPAAVARLAALAAPGADWLLADFEIAPAGMARLRTRAIVAALYAFFRLVCGLRAGALVPPGPELAIAGFHRRRRQTWEWGLLKSEWWQRK